jgi:hypothetical protein
MFIVDSNNIVDEDSFQFTRKDVQGFLIYLLTKPIYEVLKTNKAMLCGGYMRLLYLKDFKSLRCKGVSDIDLYFRSLESLNNVVNYFKHIAKNYDEPFSEAEISNHTRVNETENAITLHANDFAGIVNNASTLHYIKPLQLIKLHMESSDPSQVYRNFDFTVCQCGWDFYTDSLHYSPQFVQDNNVKILKINYRSAVKTKPIKCLHRILKYIKKGYHISKEQCIGLLLLIYQSQINNSKVEDHKTVGPLYNNDLYYSRLLKFFKEYIKHESRGLDKEFYKKIMDKYDSPYNQGFEDYQA